MGYRLGKFILATGVVVFLCLQLCFCFSVFSLRSHDWEHVQERVRRMGGESVIVDTAMRVRGQHKALNNGVVIIQKDSSDWPAVFKEGGVEEVQIRPDCVLIDFRRRMCLLAFEEGVSGYGTRRISDRLWYWGGEESGLRHKQVLGSK